MNGTKEGNFPKGLGMIIRVERWTRERKNSSRLSSGIDLKHINNDN
jgi:hypothetical protein